MNTWKKFTGSKLANGTHAAYHQELCALIEKTGTAVLHIETQFPAYKEAIEKEQSLIKKITASPHSVDVQNANARCDQWIRLIINIIKAYLKAPKDSEFYKHAVRLKGISSTYDGITEHEQSRQITETKGMVATLQAEENATPTEKLGLDALASQLATDNLRLEEAIRARNSEEANFMKQYGTQTASKQRAIVDKLYEQIVTLVNAYNVVESDAKIDAFIIEAIATTNYFANVMTQGGTKKPDLDPNPTPTPDPDPDPDGTGDSESPDEI